MPIRMEEDPKNNQGQNQNRGKSGSGGMSMIIRFLPLVIMFLIKRPKLLVPALLIGAGWYFFFGGKEMLSGGFNQDSGQIDPNFFFGATLSEEEYDKAQVFEPLATSYGYGGLPASVSLEKYAPRRMQQGRQGSCVGWASAYAARTILHSRATGKDPNQVVFSPSYLYNQIHLENCQGAYMLEAMKSMRASGSLPFQQFGYDENTCSNYPSQQQIAQGRQYNIKGYNRLTMGAGNYKPDLAAIKQNIAQGAPVVIGMMVGGSFMRNMVGQDVWYPTRSDYNLRGFSGHAMCIIGYDDRKEGGAFQIMNSWGEQWGRRGIAWVRYNDFGHFTKEAYGLYPMGSSEQYDQNKLAVEFGLLDVNAQKTIPLQKRSDIVFETTQPISKSDKFKVLIANSIECYVYVFGEETDGSSYVLFPYTSKHSPYCGITGTRLFPRDFSMTPDEIGNKDRIAIVITKKELDFNQFNNQLNQSSANSYAGKLRAALGNQRITDATFKDGSTIAFNANAKGKNAVGMIIEIDKQ